MKHIASRKGVEQLMERDFTKNLKEARLVSKRIIVGAIVAFFLINSSVSFAATRNAKLDAVASGVAGRPIAANCYLDPDQYSWDFTYDLWGIYGVWFSSMPNDVFISPYSCEPLITQQSDGLKDAGLRYFANGVRTLVHESFHARSNGVWSEADTEACAMKYLPRAVEQFGIYSTKTIAVKQVKTRWVRRKVHGRIVRYRTSRVVTVWRDIANSDYAHILGWAGWYHDQAPPQYLNGTCPA
jgi:hypothetical protein